MSFESAPDKRAPAPLDLVQRFVNSVDYDDGEEELTSPDALQKWLVQRELVSGDQPVAEADLRRAIDVREGLRALLLANNGYPLDSAAVDRLNRAAGRAGLLVRIDEEGDPELEPDAAGVDGAIAKLMGVVARSTADGTWFRLKACPKDSCLWAFYDHSKNRSAKWCRMEACGNVEKARKYRQRHRASAPSP
jgi:predicted RNA-binding Zn ribbon-like protein